MFYVYPMRNRTSFNLIATKQIEYLRKYYRDIYQLDEIVFPQYIPHIKDKAIVHPSIFIMNRVLSSMHDLFGRFDPHYYEWWRRHYPEVVGFDVCDSDKMSDIAVKMLNLLDKVAVPSTYCAEVYKSSGVRAKVYYIPHGVDSWFFDTPTVWEISRIDNFVPALLELYAYKKQKKKKILLFWLWHSPDRKGWDEVKEVYRQLRRIRNDVILVLKTEMANTEWFQQVMDLGAVNVYGWLDEFNKMALYDLADITLNFSRGGAWEMNCFESLARGVPCVATDYGSWLDYENPRFLVKRGRKVQPLPGNHIHVGYGYAVDVDSAVAKINEILDNYDEYKLIAEDHRLKLREEFTWDKIAQKIVKMLED